jgi:HEAT repeat protein
MQGQLARLGRTLGIRPGEGRTVVVTAGLFALLEVGRGLGEVGADTLVLRGYGPEGLPAVLPFLYIGLGLLGLVVAIAYTAALGRFGPARVIPGMVVLAALGILMTWLSLGSGAEAALAILWLLVFTAGTLIMTVSWTVAGTTFDARQAKRVFPLLTAAAIGGSFVGTLAAGPVASLAGAETLVVLEAAALLLAVPIVARLARASGRLRATDTGGAHQPGRASVVGQLRVGFDTVAASPLLRRVALAYVLLAILAMSVTYPFNISAAGTFDSDADLATALGLLSATVTAVSFLLSVLVANRLYARFGVSIGALALPVVYLGGFLVWLVRFTFVTAATFRVVQQVTQRGLSNAAWSAFYGVVPSERRAQVLAFNDGVPGQVGTIVSGLLLLAAGRVLAPDQFFWIGAITAAIAVVVVLGIRRGYGEALLGALRSGPAERVLEGGPGVDVVVRDPSVRGALVSGLVAPEPGIRELAATLLGTDQHATARAPLRAALRDGDARVRAAAVRSLARLPGGFGPDDDLTDLRVADPDPVVRAAAVVARAGSDPAAALALVADESEAVRAAAIASLGPGSLAGGTRHVAIAALDDDHRVVRDAAARVLAADDGPADELVRVAVTGPVRASRPALRALAERAERLGPDDDVRDPVLTFALGRVERAGNLRRARLSLGSHGDLRPDDPLDLLVDTLAYRERDLLQAGLGALAVLGATEAAGLIRRCLADDDPQVRAQAIEAIDSIGDRRLGRAVVRLIEGDTGPTADRGTVLDALVHDEDPWVRRLAHASRGEAAVPEATRSLSDLDTMLALRRVSLFEGLDPEDLYRIALTAVERRYPEGTEIMHEGDAGDELVVLVEGRVRVERAEPDGSVRLLRTYETGDHFGELAVLRERPRAATVVADIDARGLVVSGRALKAILRERPDAAMAMLATLAERISRQ